MNIANGRQGKEMYIQWCNVITREDVIQWYLRWTPYNLDVIKKLVNKLENLSEKEKMDNKFDLSEFKIKYLESCL